MAATDSTVLISGETGTGKELVARAIHGESARKHRPLVKVNCSAISAGLVESELFGHVKGAFTGAIERRVGRFELAAGGTIFLDEIGELPLETQVKLLRVLQEREFEPVGSNRTVSVDVRVIAATNRDIEDAVRGGRFRSDLFYRLNVVPIEVPPLRERRSDIPQLVMFFLARFAKKFGKRIETVRDDTMQRLVEYSWPGNVRELQNIVERAVVLTRGPVLELEGSVLPLAGGADRGAAGHRWGACSFGHSRRGRARPHRGDAGADGLGDRRPQGCGAHPRAPSQHAPQPDGKARHQAPPPPGTVAALPRPRHDISELLETSHHDTSWVSRADQGGWKRSPRDLVRDVHHPVRHGACPREKRPGRARRDAQDRARRDIDRRLRAPPRG